MELNIDSLLNLTLDDKGISNLFQKYSDNIESEITMVQKVIETQKKLEDQKEINQIKNYQQILKDLDLLKLMQNLCEWKAEFFESLDEIRISLEKEDENPVSNGNDIIKGEVLDQTNKLDSLLATALEINFDSASSDSQEVLEVYQQRASEKFKVFFDFFKSKTEVVLRDYMQRLNIPLKR